MNEAKCGVGGCFSGNNKIYIAGGYDGLNKLLSIEEYDAINNKWRILDKFTL